MAVLTGILKCNSLSGFKTPCSSNQWEISKKRQNVNRSAAFCLFVTIFFDSLLNFLYQKYRLKQHCIVKIVDFRSYEYNIYGPRQVGKSTLIEKVFPNINYVTLDDIELRDFALRGHKGFIKYYSHPLIIEFYDSIYPIEIKKVLIQLVIIKDSLY